MYSLWADMVLIMDSAVSRSVSVHSALSVILSLSIIRRAVSTMAMRKAAQESTDCSVAYVGQRHGIPPQPNTTVT